MIRLEQYEEVQAQSTLVILSDKKTKLDKTLGEEAIAYNKKFQKSDDKFDFLKGANGFTFFVKSDQKAEELRVVGAKIITQLSKDVKSVSLIGTAADQLNIAEGMLLSSYQFIKYFKDADKKKLGLETVLLSKEVSTKKINELIDTAKAVFWARDRVNEPVSHLNATQLAEAISELGTEAGMTVQV